MPFTDLNWLAVVVAAVMNMLVGFIWYGPLFGQTWLRLIGKSAQDIEGDNSVFATSAMAALVSAYVLTVAIGGVGVTSLVHGALAGAFLWIGIGSMVTLVHTIFEGPLIPCGCCTPRTSRSCS